MSITNKRAVSAAKRAVSTAYSPNTKAISDKLANLHFVDSHIVGGENSYFNKSSSAIYNMAWIECFEFIANNDNSTYTDSDFVYTAIVNKDNLHYINRLPSVLEPNPKFKAKLDKYIQLSDEAKANKYARQEQYRSEHPSNDDDDDDAPF